MGYHRSVFIGSTMQNSGELMRFVTFFMMIVLVCFTQSEAMAQVEGCEQQKCVGIVDAGSSGSRLHLYSYDLDSNKDPINITERGVKKIKPGLASIDVTEESINNYFNSLFSGTTAPHHWPVYIYATAGMRLLPSPKQQQIHALVKAWFNNKQSNWQLISSRTITGSDEGLFGWFAVNYQLGYLSKNGMNNEKKGIGVIDIGGASAQISFPVTNTQGINQKDIRAITVNGQPSQLFVKSFLGLGLNEVTHQLLDTKDCFVNGYPLPSGESAEGNANSCSERASPLINDVHQVSASVRHGQYFNPVERWYVIGGAVDSMVKSPVFDFKHNFFNSEELLYKAQVDVCQQPWSSLSAKYPKDEYMYGYCLLSSYFYALMVDGYGILPEKNINTLKSNQNADWTIGAVFGIEQQGEGQEQEQGQDPVPVV